MFEPTFAFVFVLVLGFVSVLYVCLHVCSIAKNHCNGFAAFLSIAKRSCNGFASLRGGPAMACARCVKHPRNSDFFCQGCPQLFCITAKRCRNDVAALRRGPAMVLFCCIARGSCNAVALGF